MNDHQPLFNKKDYMMLPRAFSLTPEYRDYVWGGQRLRPGMQTAEAWVIYDGNRIPSGPLAGRTLGDVVAHYGADVLGESVLRSRGKKFPLLIKLLDCFQWLSLQVHPNDQQAVELEGVGQNGKTEAWHILEAAPDAKIIAGLKSGTTAQEMEQATRQGTIEALAQYLPMHKGDTVFMRAGTLHALGPGLLVYEVQQASDITYRVFDWNRTPTPGRVLHIEKSLAVIDSAARSQPIPEPVLGDGESTLLCQSEYFQLQLVHGNTKAVSLNTGGESFHTVTVIEGHVRFLSGNEKISIGRFDSLLIPASTGEYHLEPDGEYRLLIAHL
jgi:mannose-6-phosphate isomerase